MYNISILLKLLNFFILTSITHIHNNSRNIYSICASSKTRLVHRRKVMHLKYANGKKRNENDNNGVYTYGVGSSTVANVVVSRQSTRLAKLSHSLQR